MTRLLEGKVAFVTGAARGQGRAHAVRMAQEGADIIAVDICGQISTVPYSMATEGDLSETASAVEAEGGRILTLAADVRDYEGLKAAVDEGVARFGRLDVVSANAGIFTIGPAHELSVASWKDMLDVNLRGVWHTAKASVPHLITGGGGSIIVTSSFNGLVSAPMYAHYCAAKHGVVGLTKSLAMELAAHRIRANAVLPGWVLTDMVRGYRDEGLASVRYVGPRAPPRDTSFALDAPDISNVVVFLASELSKYVTGATIPVMGMAIKASERMAEAMSGNGLREP